MRPSRIPEGEAGRLQALRDLEILDTAPEQEFDHILSIATAATSCPFATFSLIDSDRQWFKARVGVAEAQRPRQPSFCGYVVADDAPLIVEDTLRDDRFANNPYGTRFYAGFPVHARGGEAVGTLCVMDSIPHAPSKWQIEIMASLARQVDDQLELRRKLAQTEREALDQRQLVMMLAHDIRSPLTAIACIADLLAHAPVDECDNGIIAGELAAASERMKRMVSNMLDIARSQSTTLQAAPTATPIAELLHAMDAEAKRAAAAAERSVVFDVDLPRGLVLRVDRDLLMRIVANLLENAFKYGEGNEPIAVRVGYDGSVFTLRVADDGEGIPEHERERIFDAGHRLRSDSHVRTSYGMGLTFCRTAAIAMGGRIFIEGGEQGRGTVFCAEIPAPRV